MKSIQTKIVVLIMMVVMLCSIVIGGIGVLHLESLSDQNSAQIMNLSCREEGKKHFQKRTFRKHSNLFHTFSSMFYGYPISII